MRSKGLAGRWERAIRGPVELVRCCEVERLVWVLAVVDLTPAVEGGLGVLEAAQWIEGQHFGGQAAVEALVLAAALRMVRLGVDGLHAELEQPQLQRRPLSGPAAAPWRAVVDIDRLGQAMVAESPFQASSHGLRLLVGAGRQADGEARMVVDHRQGMQPGATVQAHAALEVHLP